MLAEGSTDGSVVLSPALSHLVTISFNTITLHTCNPPNTCNTIESTIESPIPPSSRRLPRTCPQRKESKRPASRPTQTCHALGVFPSFRSHAPSPGHAKASQYPPFWDSQPARACRRALLWPWYWRPRTAVRCLVGMLGDAEALEWPVAPKRYFRHAGTPIPALRKIPASQ